MKKREREGPREKVSVKVYQIAYLKIYHIIYKKNRENISQLPEFAMKFTNFTLWFHQVLDLVLIHDQMRIDDSLRQNKSENKTTTKVKRKRYTMVSS